MHSTQFCTSVNDHSVSFLGRAIPKQNTEYSFLGQKNIYFLTFKDVLIIFSLRFLLSVSLQFFTCIEYVLIWSVAVKMSREDLFPFWLPSCQRMPSCKGC